MLTQKELFALNPPDGLSNDELEKWYRARVCEPDGSMIMNDNWEEDEPKPAPPVTPPSGETIKPK